MSGRIIKKPWDFQEAAVKALWDQIHLRPKESTLVVMPTGTGKSLTMALFVWWLKVTYPYTRVLNLVHVKELVKGNSEALTEIFPAAPVGVVSAGLGRRETACDIIYAGEKTYKNVKSMRKFDFIIIDEAHRISDKEKTGYRQIIARERLKNPNVVVIGFTATDYREGAGRLVESGIFDRVCFDLSSGEAFLWLVKNYYLIRLRSVKTDFAVDSSAVSIRAGEFNETEASAAFRDQDIIERAVDDIILRGAERQSWLIFAQSIADAELIGDMFNYKKFPVGVVHSKMDGDRDEVLERFAAGEYRGIVNQNVLTTGYDNRDIDLLAFLRLINSASLWVQCLGRGTRPAWTPGFDLGTVDGRRESILASHKHDCLVLDYARNIDRLGPINYPRIPKRRGSKGGEPPIRTCPQCGTDNHISLRHCEECGFEFPRESKINNPAGSGEIVLDLTSLPMPPPKEYGVFKVSQLIAAPYKAKPGKPPTVKVDYFCGVRRFSTWLCPEHVGFPRNKTEEWWRLHGGVGPCPDTCAALSKAAVSLNLPKYLKVWVNTKYPEISAYDFAGTRFELPPEFGGPSLEEIAQREQDEEAEAVEVAEAMQQLEDEEAEVRRRALEMFDDEVPF